MSKNAKYFSEAKPKESNFLEAKVSECLNQNIKGFILSAGFSKRLRPITEYIPKPLLPLTGEVLLDYIYNLLKSSGIEHIGINLHYKAKEIEQYIKERELPLSIFHEKDILNTGGALYNAKDFLKDSVFIVHNSDIYWDGNIKDAIEWHINSGNAITLLVHDYPPDNKLITDKEDNLIGINSSDSFKHHVAFTGIAIYSPDILELLPEGPSSVIDLWFKAISKGFKVKVFSAKYNFWYDIGTPIGYARAVFEKLKRNFSSIYAHPTSLGCELIKPNGKIVIEKDVKIKKSFKGKNLIILTGTEFLAETEQIEDCIIGNDFIVSISGWQREEENLTAGGSTRKYFRKGNKVFCEWNNAMDDFERTVFLSNFFKQKRFPVPEIINIKRDSKLIAFEDLGELTLYSWLQCKRKDEEIFKIYKKVIENIVKLHWQISSDVSEKQLPIPQFDYDYFQWESEYFLEECLKGVFRIECKVKPNLEKELHLIAEMLSKAKKVILHRDLQSQNIMLKDDKIYFVDYQSARWGPAGYDLASLLWDPYVKLKNKLRQEFVNFYIEKTLSLLSSSTFTFNPSVFLEELSLCRIQRHMQALGAYGFLSLKRGKKNFLKFIPSALNLLIQDIEECAIELPYLRKLVIKVIHKFQETNYQKI